MGLSAPKKRTRIGHDPNNTSWTSSTSRYGHRLLTSAGWTPGQTLGAKNAAHSAHYTAASESHIRIAPCVEGKGLGAKNTTDDTFGLRLLSGLLGRLNGKDTTLIEEQLDRRRGEGYIEQRGWGVHFIFGGYLVGDKVEKDLQDVAVMMDPDPRKKSKKRKDVSSGAESASTSKTKKAKKYESSAEVDAARLSDNPPDQSMAVGPSESSLERRAAKALRKEARRLKREKKEKKRLRKQKTSTSYSNASEGEGIAVSAPEDSDNKSAKPAQATDESATSGTSTPAFSGGRGRHAMRHKYIDQKRMACMDAKALNEIFMIKSNG